MEEGFAELTDDATGKKPKTGSFQSMGLIKELLWGMNRMGYNAPTPIQRKALPIALAGMDMVCMARTGSGKTCVFLLPMMQKLKAHDGASGVRGVVLSPTRELATQTFKFAKDFAKFTDLRVISVIGGDPIEPQFEALSTRPDVIIGTPGRLMHHLHEISTFKLKHVQYLVFDEADRLFEMGFAEQLNEIVKECPEGRQTLLFSATLPKLLVQFTRAGLRDPQLIRLDTDVKMSEELRVAFFAVRSNEKVAALLYVVRCIIPPTDLTIVFTATRHHSEFLHMLFQKIGVTSTLVYGSMDQDARSANLNAFRKGQVSYLIVTDLAARGIDVPLLNNVINFHFPQAPKLFVHRCGRAARQGRIGFAMSLVEPDEMAYMADVHMLLTTEVDVAYNRTDSEGSQSKRNCNDDQITEQDADGHSNSTNVTTVSTSNYTGGNSNRRLSYTLETMTPEMIHTGLLPQDVLDEENEFFKRAITDDDNLANMWRVCENGMKQYKRTRSEASRHGVKIAKRLSKDGAIRDLHPLIVGCDPKRCDPSVVQKAEFVRMLQKFRPAQTVFESGIGFGTGSQAIKAKSKAGSKEAHGVDVMRALRKVTAASLERNKVSLKASLAAKQTSNSEGHGDDEDNDDDDDEDGHSLQAFDHNGDDDNHALDAGDLMMNDEFDTQSDNGDGSSSMHRQETGKSSRCSGSAGAGVSGVSKNSHVSEEPAEKPRLSIAERRKLKKKGASVEQIHKLVVMKALTKQAVNEGTMSTTGNKRGGGGGCGGGSSEGMGLLEGLELSGGTASTYKDERFFMSYGNEDESARFTEDLLQPQSGLRDLEIQSASKLEHAFLDVSSDSALHENKNKRITRWDAKKRKFVRQSLEEMANLKGSKRLRTEYGAPVRKSTRPQGEMYEKWKKKTRREVSLPGTAQGDDDNRPRPNVKFNKNAKDELKSKEEIRKAKKTKEQNKLKNMQKDKRSKIEAKKRQAKSSGMPEKFGGPKAGNKKLKAILRY